MKIGSVREDIYAHRRILQPIIRRRIQVRCDKNTWIHNMNSNADFVEVQNLVDKDWYNGMTEKEIEEILFTIYSELRSKGLVWLDIKKENVGRLLKPNKTNISIFLDEKRNKIEGIPPNEAIGFIGKAEGDVLQAGEHVIIDSSYVVREEEHKKQYYYTPGQTYKFDKYERRYQESLKQQGEGR